MAVTWIRLEFDNYDMFEGLYIFLWHHLDYNLNENDLCPGLLAAAKYPRKIDNTQQLLIHTSTSCAEFY